MSEKTEIKSVRCGNSEMKYFSFGRGERALVILPGASVTSVMLLADAVAQAYACFAEKYTVYLFDIKNDIDEGYSVEDMADDTVKAMDLLGIKSADIFGCSLGGMIAQLIALRCPSIVRKMILASTLSRQNALSSANFAKWEALAKSGDIAAVNHDLFRCIYSPAYYEEYKDLFASIEGNGSAEDMWRFAVIINAAGRFDCYSMLEKIACPVFVIGSHGDAALSGEASEETAEKLGCRLYMYSDYGHAVYDEAPDYKERMMQFLDENFAQY